MSVRVVLRVTSFLIVLLITQIGSAKPRPNFLLIVVDDQSPLDLQIYNPSSELQTPTIDQLARDGMVFDQAYHMGSMSGAVCTPSRHMIMTGRMLWNYQKGTPPADSQFRGRKGWLQYLATQSLPAVFNRAGYDTMRTCKRGNSFEAANQQFTMRKDATKRGGTRDTSSVWHADQVLEYLDQRKASDDEDPFLIYFGFSHPHDTRDGTPELLEKYGAVNHTDQSQRPSLHPQQPKLPVMYLPKHPFHHGHPNLRDEVKVSGVWENRDVATVRNELGREFACSELIDQQIDRVFKKLEAGGELANTYVIYTSDHGIAIGRHGLMGKQNLYQHTWRVPYIVKGPGIKAGSRVTGNIYLLDTLATLCDLADVESPPTNEGLSFREVLFGERESVRDVLYGAYCGGTKPGMRCVKKGDWKLIKYDVLDGTVRETQLFNLADNPHELLAEHHRPEVVEVTKYQPSPQEINLADDPKYRKQLREMEALLLSEQQRLNDPYRLWDQPARDSVD